MGADELWGGPKMTLIRWLAFSFLAISLILLGLSAWAFRHIPNMRDLYSVIYPTDLGHQTESTLVFLFVFPLFCLSISILMLWHSRTGGRFLRDSLPAGAYFAVVLFALFAFGAITRLVALEAHFGF